MLHYTQLKRLPIITLKEGRRVGFLDEVLVDQAAKTVAWLRMRSRNWFAAPRWAPASAVHGLGPDAVILDSTDAVTDQPNLPEDHTLMEARRDLLGRPVLLETGQRLGQVRDFELSPDNLALTSVHVMPPMQLMGQPLVLPVERLLTLGPDALLARHDRDASQPEAPAEAKSNANRKSKARLEMAGAPEA